MAELNSMENPIDPKRLSEAIRQLRAEYVRKNRVGSYFAINCGDCDNFASDLIRLLPDLPLEDVQNENFMVESADDEFPSDWDWQLLRKHWKISAPKGLTQAETDALDIGCHVWIAYEGKHYDAECPEGVESFFDLPLFRRNIVSALREKGIATPDVVTDDIVEPPSCPVPNPERSPRRRSAATQLAQ